MPIAAPSRRLLQRLLPAALLALAAAGCEDKLQPVPEPTFTRAIVRFEPAGQAPQIITVTRATSSASGPLTVPAAGGLLEVTYLDADGEEDRVMQLNAAAYETRLQRPASLEPVLTVTRLGSHSFQLGRTQGQTGTGTVQVQLYHITARHTDMDAPLTVVAQ